MLPVRVGLDVVASAFEEGIEVEEITMAEGVKLRNLEEALCEDIQDYIDAYSSHKSINRFMIYVQ